ncbi:hypothetical protein [Micromonospora profundi]|uniref:hypothetical protein n=1 Tax=Micromonospora profundi TaxID=1420889 RepID=UPI0037F5A910
MAARIGEQVEEHVVGGTFEGQAEKPAAGGDASLQLGEVRPPALETISSSSSTASTGTAARIARVMSAGNVGY